MRILMKLLYAARIARYDLQKAINTLGSQVHRWDDECEHDLKRSIAYVQSSLDRLQYAWVGDNIVDIKPHLYADANFASCTRTAKPTNGVHLCLRGPRTNFRYLALRSAKIAYHTRHLKRRSLPPPSLYARKACLRSSYGSYCCGIPKTIKGPHSSDYFPRGQSDNDTSMRDQAQSYNATPWAYALRTD